MSLQPAPHPTRVGVSAHPALAHCIARGLLQVPGHRLNRGVCDRLCDVPASPRDGWPRDRVGRGGWVGERHRPGARQAGLLAGRLASLPAVPPSVLCAEAGARSAEREQCRATRMTVSPPFERPVGEVDCLAHLASLAFRVLVPLSTIAAGLRWPLV